MSMQYGLLQRTLAVAIEILIASDLLDVLHLHDFDAITFLHLSILMQETSKVDAIATSHQNDFDAITLLYLSILASFRSRKNFNPMNSSTFVLFGKYCPIVDQLSSKDSSRDFQLNCAISYFFYLHLMLHANG